MAFLSLFPNNLKPSFVSAISQTMQLFDDFSMNDKHRIRPFNADGNFLPLARFDSPTVVIKVDGLHSSGVQS
jgi:hypothetical protein